MSLFPVCSPRENMAPFSIPLSALIVGDTSGLVVPVYPRGESPEPNFFYLSTYITGASPLQVVPVYSSTQAIMTAFSRSTSAITATPS